MDIERPLGVQVRQSGNPGGRKGGEMRSECGGQESEAGPGGEEGGSWTERSDLGCRKYQG